VKVELDNLSLSRDGELDKPTSSFKHDISRTDKSSLCYCNLSDLSYFPLLWTV